ncbi:Glycosyltransferase involved in cell wall bisynthesis [Pseudobutyrivibrio sp. ACV-2]|uniref:glycosyltransferase family 2 protein n=1 Tax=Pseudobutyrivibrio sp. ACV-2 TaxID=1520801 RepID=UPI00089732FF|nr:glycosyltransferase [Pseudobutyrivibrio sp. ACV-2]SEA29946.1 Glycosyltransferase involved in cell wall bisynthesis [Pseudobutyrivibrio sp. ACV-2]
MNENVEISIVVPVCNVGAYLEECLDSILNQTFKSFEAICVNDGSTDNSLDILREYEKKDKRIKVITKANSGYGNTMNVGMDAAQGRYICIIESDDYVDKHMLERLFDSIEKYDADVVKSDHYIFSTKNGKNRSQFQAVCPDEYYNRVLNVTVCPEIFTFTMMNWTGIYKTEYLRENNIRHNETPGASFQDNGFWFQAISMANKIVFINEAFYYYRQDNPNSSINNKKKVFCICDEYKFMREILDSHKEFGEEIHKRFFEKKLFNYLNSYNRVAIDYKLEFLEHISKEFEEDLKDPLLRVESLDPWIFMQVNRIIDSPKLFMLEDCSVRYRDQYNESHEKLVKIRNSEEFKRGIKVKELLHVK